MQVAPNKLQRMGAAKSVNIAIAVFVILTFLSGAYTNSFGAGYALVFGILFIIWLLFNLYLNERQNFFRNLLTAILNIIVVLFLYVILTTVFVGISYLAYNSGYIDMNTFNYISEVSSLLPLSLSVFIYLMVYKVLWTNLSPMAYGKNPRAFDSGSIPRQLGFGTGTFTSKNIMLGLMIFAVILCIEVAVSLASAATNVQVNTNVDTVFAGAPLWFLLFAAVIEPINEEIFFRGFLVPRLGIWPSAIIFGLAHYSYNSSFGIEMLAAFALAVMAGYVYKRTGSIYPGLVAHILINSIAALSLFGMGS